MVATSTMERFEAAAERADTISAAGGRRMSAPEVLAAEEVDTFLEQALGPSASESNRWRRSSVRAEDARLSSKDTDSKAS